jgi:CheY-like chemotaxis protein
MSRAPKILLVEDHVDSLNMTAKLLRVEGYDVATARTQSEALELCKQQKFDLLIGDVGLPDGSGLELMREVARKCNVKGIACTGYGYESDIEKSKAAGFSAHLTKPIDFKLLSATIARLLADAAPGIDVANADLVTPRAPFPFFPPTK